MRPLLLLICMLSLGLTGKAQDFLNTETKIYLVRHAEKLGGQDPGLTPAGLLRAGDLYRTLKNKGIQRIYVTGYKRTQMTGDSLRINLNIDTIHYKADTIGDDLVRKIKANGDIGKTILVIGHSNTIPKLIRRLDNPLYPARDIPDAVFDNLYLVKFKKKKAKLKAMKYGSPSGQSAAMKQ